MLAPNWTRGYEFWGRYLAVFDAVTVAARAAAARGEDAGGGAAVTGAGVRFAEVQDYSGALGFLNQGQAVRGRLRALVRGPSALVARCPGGVGISLTAEARRLGKAYGVELVGDPRDVFAPGAIRHPLRPVLRWYLTQQTRKDCRSAAAVSYVTADVLQRRYPTAGRAFSVSDADLPETWFADTPRRDLARPERPRLILVGTMDQAYKGIDLLIEAVARCAREGVETDLVLVGDGKLRGPLEALARRTGAAGRVAFLGMVRSRERLREELDQAELFVLPSRTEGLPRAMLEAMARGLPCIGASVGGIPELLPPEDLVPPNDTRALARKLIEVLEDPPRMRTMSARNLEKAREYRAGVLERRRVEFYQAVREGNEPWLAQRR